MGDTNGVRWTIGSGVERSASKRDLRCPEKGADRAAGAPDAQRTGHGDVLTERAAVMFGSLTLATADTREVRTAMSECAKCYRDGGAGPWCEETCERPECGPCGYARWAEAHPLEALREEYISACEYAECAEESQFDDWRQAAAIAEELGAQLEQMEEAELADASSKRA